MSKSTLLCTGMVLVAFGSGLGGCHARTELADVSDGGEGPTGGTSSQQSGGRTSGGTGSSEGGSQTGGTAGANSSGGVTGGTGNVAGSPAGGGGGTGGQCFDNTVDGFCHYFPCPARGGDGLQNILDFYEARGICDEFPILADYDTCGAEIFRFNGGYTSESFLYISGTLGATAITSDSQFGPCDTFHYYGGIELDEFYEEYGCSVVNRCLACGPLTAGDPQYPPCRSGCECIDVVIGTDPCFDPTSCECYCFQGLPKSD